MLSLQRKFCNFVTIGVVVATFLILLLPKLTLGSVVEQAILNDSGNWTWSYRQDQSFDFFQVFHNDTALCFSSLPYPTTPQNLIGNDDMDDGLVFNCSSFSEGELYKIISYDNDFGTSTLNYDISFFTILNGKVSDLGLNSTRIISLVPVPDSTVATSSSFVLGATGYINESDFDSDLYLNIDYKRNEEFQGTGAVALFWNNLQIPISSFGYFDLSTTTSILSQGKYTVKTSVKSDSWLTTIASWWGLDSSLNNSLVSTTTFFIAGQATALDIMIASTTEAVEAFMASSTVSMASCVGWSSFNLVDCLSLLLIPNSTQLTESVKNFATKAKGVFPIGYFTDFVSILSTTTVTAIPVISATIPSGIAGAGASVNLDLSHSIDWLLNSSSTIWATQQNVPEESFVDVITPYWEYLIYIALGFYLVSRVLGSHIIGRVLHKTI